jgi:hypothetical protein
MPVCEEGREILEGFGVPIGGGVALLLPLTA